MARNGKIMFSAPVVNIKGVTINPGCTVYNVFEGNQKTTGNSLTSFTAENVTVNDTDLKHNVFNIYNPEDNATIKIKDCTFNVDVNNTNILRLSNIKNATGVTVEFENVDWTYENGSNGDWDWAGLVIFQPFGSDLATNGDNSAIETWTFKFKNCKYNGTKVTSNNMGEHNQAIYFYNMNKDGKVSAPVSTLVFE